MNHSEALAALKAVLCDPDGKCSIHGSEADRQQVDAAIAALGGGWMPIESALVGVSILAFDGENIEVAVFDGNRKGYCTICYGEYSFFATHWMPLPAPPKEQE